MKKFAQVVVPLPLEGPFDYAIPEQFQNQLKVGQRVLISFGPRKVVGFCVGLQSQSTVPASRVKPLLKVLDNDAVLDEKFLKFTKEFSQYYGCSWGEAIKVALPALLQKSTSREILSITSTSSHQKINVLLKYSNFQNHLKHLRKNVQEVLAQEQSVCVIVPESAYVPVVRQQLEDLKMKNLISMDKRWTQNQEFQAWQQMKSGNVNCVIGPRSLIFSPLPNCALLIVIDEEHSSYKQEQSPFYHVRDVAWMRSKSENWQMIFTSVAPSMEILSYVRSQELIEEVVKDSSRAVEVQCIDLNNFKSKRSAYLSFPLQNEIEQILKDGGKFLVFLNRVGFTRMAKCPHCDHIVQCPHCEVALVYSYSKKQLKCRRCSYEMTKSPKKCPECHKSYFQYLGAGVEKLSSDIARFFPQAKVIAFDSETKQLPKRFDIVVATQAIVKPQYENVFHAAAVIDLDCELHRMDFRSGHRTFALVSHLKFLAKTKVIVQTRLMDNYCVKALQKNDYNLLVKHEMEVRESLGFPPFQNLVALNFRGMKEESVLVQASSLYEKLNEILHDHLDIHLMEPHPDVIPKLRDQSRFVVMVQGKDLSKMLELIKQGVKKIRKKQGVIVTLNVNP